MIPWQTAFGPIETVCRRMRGSAAIAEVIDLRPEPTANNQDQQNLLMQLSVSWSVPRETSKLSMTHAT